MPSCCVKWCRSHSDMKNTGLTFHVFPTDEIQRKKWVTAVRLERNECDWMPSRGSVICSIHFRSDDMYMLKDGRRKRLIKSAVPICTMVCPLKANDCHLSGPSSSTNNTNVQEEYSNEIHEVNLENICSHTQEQTLKRKLEEPGCSNIEEKKRKMIECPSCKYKFYIQTEILESEASLPASKGFKPPCGTPISVPSPEIESVFNTPRKQKLKKQLTLKMALAKKRLFKIKNLQQQKKRLNNKNLTLKNVIENL
ncbi:uncharacterized protein [Choristoneura fumiferana]|uniref:uncharacterized protein n=1 Tax=Choristoneura fumiferana TaxID=7141 RepID=UPI003D156B45